MGRKSVLDRYEPFSSGAVLGAHANTLSDGFRQQDVRFILEVFTNWVEFVEEGSVLEVQNTQIGRYVDNLVEEGFARKTMLKSYPVYRLTRAGLMELVSRTVERQHYPVKEHFYFAYYFISSYRTRIVQFVKMEGKRFPYSLQLELEELLNPEYLIDRQLENTSRELKKLVNRIEAAQASCDFIIEKLKSGLTGKQLFKELDKRHPFALNTELRHSELFHRGTEKQAIWELTVGATARINGLWLPSKRALELHIQELKELRARSTKQPVTILPDLE